MEILTIIVTAVCSGSLAWIFTLKFTRKEAEANAMSKVQEVYQKLITDINSDREHLKAENEKLSTLIKHMNERLNELEEKVRENERQIGKSSPYLCALALTCQQFKKKDLTEL